MFFYQRERTVGEAIVNKRQQDRQQPLGILLRLSALILLTLVFYLFLSFVPLKARADNPIGQMDYHADEGVWIEAGRYYFHTFFIERDWRAAMWGQPRFGAFGKPTPPLGKYLFGAALYFQPGGQYQPPPADAGVGFNWEAASKERPPQPVLEAARRPVLLLGALAATIIFLLVERMTHSTTTALLASALFVLQPLVIRDSRRAMLDMPALFFSLLALLLFVYLQLNLEQRQLKRAILLSIATGFALGLGLSTKLSAALTLVVLTSWWMLVLWGQFMLPVRAPTEPDGVAPVVASWPRRLVLPAITLLLILLTAAITFFALNPLLYSQPLQGLKEIMGLASIVRQYDVPPEQRLDTLAERLLAVYRIGFVYSGPLSYWLRLPFVDAVLAFFGVAFCVYRVRAANGSQVQRVRAAMLLLWAGVTVAGIIYWVPFSWLRWYLPLEPVWAVFEAGGGAGFIHALRAFGQRWSLQRA